MGSNSRQSRPSRARGLFSSTKRTSQRSRAETAAEQRLWSASLSPSKLSAPPLKAWLKLRPPAAPGRGRRSVLPSGVSKYMRRPAGPVRGSSGPRYMPMPPAQAEARPLEASVRW